MALQHTPSRRYQRPIWPFTGKDTRSYWHTTILRKLAAAAVMNHYVSLNHQAFSLLLGDSHMCIFKGA